MDTYSLVDNEGIPIMNRVLKYIGNIKNGTYLEAGAYDGITQSNTKYLDDIGWSGVLIEPSKNTFDRLIINRPSNHCINCCLVSSDYKKETISGDFNGKTMSSVNGARLNSNFSCEVRALTLDTVLSQCNIQNIDFMSLDTEGYELEVLKGLDFSKISPKYILIEIYNHMYNDIVEYLSTYNYSMVENISKYNNIDTPGWDGTHNDYLFKLNN